MQPRSISWHRLEKKWNEIQVGRQGSYSIERLESLNNYCNTTSTTRAVLICILTPLPALAVALLLESIPLRPPSEGWAANWAFWIRLFLMQSVISFAVSSQMSAFVPGLNFTLVKRLIVALGASCAFTGLGLLAASMIKFPVPLMLQLGAFPIGILMPVMLRIVLGPALFARDSRFKYDSDRFHRVLVAQIILVGVYPLYKVLYDFVPESYKIVVVVVALPLWKFGAKHLTVRAARQLEDYIPQLVAFTVDFFSTLFVARCISSAGSPYFSGLIFTADIAASLLEFREVRNNTRGMLQLVRDRQASSKLLPRTGKQQDARSSELLEILLNVARNPRAFHIKLLPKTRLWACLPHPITNEQLSQLQALGSLGVYVQEGLQPTERRRFRIATVSPAPTSNMVVRFAAEEDELGLVGTLFQTIATSTDAASTEKSKMLVVQGLQLMFHTEYLILVEYVECVVPLIFLVYELVLKELPNAIYYPDDVKNWGVSTTSNLLVLSALEVGSFWFVYRLLRQTFGISSVHQLAFVLETQGVVVQVYLLASCLILLQYQLLHLGKRFSLSNC